MKPSALVGLVVLGALAGVGAIAVFLAPSAPQRVPGTPSAPSAAPASGGGPAVAVVDAPSPTTAPASPSAAPSPTVARTQAPERDLGAFRKRMQARARGGTKQDYRALLVDWRAGTLDRAEERVLDDLLADAQRADPPPPGLIKAAGALFLATTSAPQRDALGAILATLGNEAAVGYLLEAVGGTTARAAALKALQTVSTPGVLPAFRRALDARPDDHELKAALGAALRNIDTPKARELEQRTQ